MKFAFFLVVFGLLSACAYHLGDSRRSLPGGYDRLAIPVFVNQTQEVGIESYFTNALVREFESSKVAKVADKALAPLTVEGIIETVEYEPSTQIQANKDNARMPKDTVLTINYTILVTARIDLRRNSDKKIIWTQVFKNEVIYKAPQIGSQFINSANATYNHSARHQNIADLAQLMMEEAHDRMTENF